MGSAEASVSPTTAVSQQKWEKINKNVHILILSFDC